MGCTWFKGCVCLFATIFFFFFLLLVNVLFYLFWFDWVLERRARRLVEVRQDEEGFVRRACEVLEAWHPGHPMRMNARRTMLSRDWSGIVEQMEERWRTLTAATQQLRTHDGKLDVMKTS